VGARKVKILEKRTSGSQESGPRDENKKKTVEKSCVVLVCLLVENQESVPQSSLHHAERKEATVARRMSMEGPDDTESRVKKITENRRTPQPQFMERE